MTRQPAPEAHLAATTNATIMKRIDCGSTIIDVTPQTFADLIECAAYGLEYAFEFGIPADRFVALSDLLKRMKELG